MKEDLKNYKSRDKIPLECESCHDVFYTTKNNVLRVFKSRPNDYRFCNKKCESKHKTTKIKLQCKYCNNNIEKVIALNKSPNLNISTNNCNPYDKKIKDPMVNIWINTKFF